MKPCNNRVEYYCVCNCITYKNSGINLQDPTLLELHFIVCPFKRYLFINNNSQKIFESSLSQMDRFCLYVILKNISSLITIEEKTMLQLSVIYCSCNLKKYCKIIHKDERKNVKFLFYLSGTLIHMPTSSAMLTFIILQKLLQ